jgi:hypothetical protein
MATLAPEIEPKVEIGVSNQQPLQPRVEQAVLTRPEDAAQIAKGEKELHEVLRPTVLEEPTDVVDEGKTILSTGIVPTGQISLSDEVIKNERLKWYHHVHKNIGKAVTWLVESVLRREKKEAIEKNSSL